MAARNLHKRIKHRQMPGDIMKEGKISMREGKGAVLDYGNGHKHVISKKIGKKFAKDVRSRERAVFKRRVQKGVDLDV